MLGQVCRQRARIGLNLGEGGAGAFALEGLLGSIGYVDLVGLSPDEAKRALLAGISQGRLRSEGPLSFPGNQDKDEDASEHDAADSDTGNADIAGDRNGRIDYATRRFLADADWFHKALEFFTDRLVTAFPGVRGLRTFSGPAAVTRLVRLLQLPLAVAFQGHEVVPLWWWRGISNMLIDRFQVLDEQRGRCLMGQYELLIDTVAVYRNSRDYRSFVYVATQSDQPTGIYAHAPVDIAEQVQEYGYAFEDMGYWNGHYVSRAEYDDGFAEIGGEIVRLERAEPRIRYLTPFNFFISSQTSVLNSRGGDEATDDLCQRLLQGTTTLEDVVRMVGRLELPRKIALPYFWIN